MSNISVPNISVVNAFLLFCSVSNISVSNISVETVLYSLKKPLPNGLNPETPARNIALRPYYQSPVLAAQHVTTHEQGQTPITKSDST